MLWGLFLAWIFLACCETFWFHFQIIVMCVVGLGFGVFRGVTGVVLARCQVGFWLSFRRIVRRVVRFGFGVL